MSTLKKIGGAHGAFFGRSRFALLFSILIPMSAFPQSEQESVVIVHTKPESGYGVAWNKPDNIVTALHLVAGKSPILVQWRGKESTATIVKANKNADIALLKLATPLGIPPLQVHQGDPPLDSPVDFWEAPPGVARMDRKETRLDAEARAIPLQKFDNRLEDPKHLAVFKKALCADGTASYPALTQNVFKFEERNIRKSHSGSPITFDGKIIGMVDGGEPIGGKACVWAIPAAGNFEKLLTAAATLPQQTCSTEKLYGGLRKDNPLLQADPKLKAWADQLDYSDNHPYVVIDDLNNKLAFALEYRASCEEVYETMFADGQRYIADLLEDENDFNDAHITLQNLFEQTIDLYQEDETGATIAIPANSKMTIIQAKGSKHTLLKVSEPQAGVEMVVFVKKANSPASAAEAREWFQTYIVSDGRKWEQERDAEDDDDVEDNTLADDPDEPYENMLLDRVVYDDDDHVIAELYASLTTDENNFLGVAIFVNDWENLKSTQRLTYYLMEACAILSGFAYY